MVSGDNKDLEEGVYKYDSAYRFEEYLTELGVPWYLRALSKYASPTVTIKKLQNYSGSGSLPGNENTNESWEIKTDTVFRSHAVQFTMNQPTVDKTLDGRHVKMTVTRQSENRWIEKQKNTADGKETTIVRDFFSDRMMVNLTVGAVRSFSTFIRQLKKD